MDAAQRTHRFRPERFVALVAVGAVAGIACVEFFAPEQLFPAAVATAEVELTFDSQRPPTAEQVRRRALSTANLAAVYRRLTDRGGEDVADVESADRVAEMSRWRRQIAVEVRTSEDRRRCRIRFLADEAHRDGQAAILAETVAAQYAADVVAERRDPLVDRPEIPGESALAEIESPHHADDEFVDLMNTRARLLKTLQPAHPDVVALDSRLEALRTAAADSPIRRTSAEDDARQDRRPSAARWSRIDERLEWEAAELPVVTTRDAVEQVWERRPFWHVAACLLALCVAWPASRGSRVNRDNEIAAPAQTASGDKETPEPLVRLAKSLRTTEPAVTVRLRRRPPTDAA